MSASSEGNLGLLLAMMEPPAALEEEFADWYDKEHVPERLAIAGFRTGVRLVCVDGWPKFVALYDLDSVDVLDSAGYRAVSGDGFSPWSKRILAKVRGQFRAAGVQIHPGDEVTGRFTAMTLLRLRGLSEPDEPLLVEALRTTVSAHAAAVATPGIRLFRCDNHGASVHLAMLEWPNGLVDARRFVPPLAFAASVDLMNVYVPYWQHGHLPGVYSANR